MTKFHFEGVPIDLPPDGRGAHRLAPPPSQNSLDEALLTSPLPSECAVRYKQQYKQEIQQAEISNNRAINRRRALRYIVSTVEWAGRRSTLTQSRAGRRLGCSRRISHRARFCAAPAAGCRRTWRSPTTKQKNAYLTYKATS